MKGISKVQISYASVIEAAQLLVDQQFAAPVPKVTAVHVVPPEANYNSRSSTVELIIGLQHEEAAQ